MHSKPKEKRKKNLYQPTVWVITTRLDSSVTIAVSDNGNGIPESIKEKIFHPFFTTNLTGSGTGVGLSLSYNIVKAHGGKIKAETHEDEGSSFKTPCRRPKNTYNLNFIPLINLSP